MKKNQTVARIHRGVSWLYAVSGVLLFVAIALSGAERGSLGIAFFFLALCGGFFWLHRWIAKGASSGKRWARIVSMIIAFLLLGGFPIGSLIGIFLLINTWDGWDDPTVTPENLQPIDYSKLSKPLDDIQNV